MADRGARGIKLHPVAQRFQPNDPRMRSVYDACEELGLVVLSHTGSARAASHSPSPGRSQRCSSSTSAHPGAGTPGWGSWRQTPELALAFPLVRFDLCEIVEWTGAPNAPTEEDLARLIKQVGPERVMLGTDFPWYDLDRTVELVMRLPVLSTGEKEQILGRMPSACSTCRCERSAHMANDSGAVERMLAVAIDEARTGLAEGGVPVGGALFAADGHLLGRGATGGCRRTILRSTGRPTRSARPAASRATVARPW